MDRYEYGAVPLREEVLGQIDGPDDRVLAVVTRNGYGSVVLNTEQVMFVDIDFPLAAAVGTSFFKGLFGRKQESAEDEKQQRARQPIDNFIEDNPAWGMRLYRTFAGLRAIVTHDVMDPQTPPRWTCSNPWAAIRYTSSCARAQECLSRPADAQAVAKSQPGAGREKRLPCCTVYRSIHSSAAQQRLVRGVDDCIDGEAGDVALDCFQLGGVGRWRMLHGHRRLPLPRAF